MLSMTLASPQTFVTSRITAIAIRHQLICPKLKQRLYEKHLAAVDACRLETLLEGLLTLLHPKTTFVC